MPFAELDGHVDEVRRDPNDDDRHQQEDRQGEGHLLTGGPHRLTSNVSLWVRPNTSGEYMHAALVGGITYVPTLVARAR